MDDPRAFESQESSEGQLDSAEARTLDDATFEPEAAVEQSLSYQQAEAIQATFVEVVQTADEVSDLAAPIPGPSTDTVTAQVEAAETDTVSTSEQADSSPQASEEASAAPVDREHEVGQADVPAQEMDVQLPEQRLDGGQTEGQDPLGDLQQGLPGTGVLAAWAISPVRTTPLAAA